MIEKKIPAKNHVYYEVHKVALNFIQENTYFRIFTTPCEMAKTPETSRNRSFKI
jgi:hypothetical protein